MCGAQLVIVITDLSKTEFLEFACRVNNIGSVGDPCGIVQLRGNKRRKIVKDANDRGIIPVRGALAGEYMDVGDQKCPLIPSPEVMRVAQSQAKASKRPIKGEKPMDGVKRLHSGCCRDMIQQINKVPVAVHYRTPLQTQLYNEACKRSYVKITIDATGRVVDKVIHLDGKHSGPIFLYIIVVNVDGKSIRVGQMLTESHTSQEISSWLSKWLQECPIPREAVSDDSEALLNAMAHSFAGFLTIERYSNYLFDCKKEDLPFCRIRSDAAHNIRNWCKFINSEVKMESVRTFYKAAFGQQIIATSKDEAGEILYCLFLVCSSQYAGQLDNGTDSACEAAIKLMMKRITSQYINKNSQIFHFHFS